MKEGQRADVRGRDVRIRRSKRAGPSVVRPVRYWGFAGVCASILVLCLVASFGLGTRAEVTDSGSATLYACRDMPVGDVTVSNDDDYLYVTYTLYEDSEWFLTETHLEVALSPDDIPNSNGNPRPGHFTYKGYYDDPITEVTYEVPLGEDWESGDRLVIAAHAVVSDSEVEESAWAGTEPFEGRNWATYFTYEL